MKKWYLFFTTVMLVTLCVTCCVMLSVDAQAATVANGTCGDNLTWVLDDNGILTISGTGAMAKCKLNTYPWSEYYLQIKELTIHEGVTSVAEFAFKDCRVMKKVTFPNSLTSIGEYAFANCVSLEHVTIPHNTEVDGWVFSKCTALKEVTVYGKLSGARNFEECDALEKVVLGDNCTSIPTCTFHSCYKLKEVSFPATLTSIGDQAFAYCGSLKAVTIPSSVTSIGDMAFYQCDDVEEVHITDLKAWCNISFTYFRSDGSNPLNWGNGMLYLNGELVENLVIPDSITTVKTRAFSGCKSIKSLVIPSGVTVQSMCFLNCKNLETVIIEEGMTVVPMKLFWNCSNLKEVTLPASLSVIDEKAFYMDGKKQIIEVVNYAGTPEQWNNISILSGNEQITVAYQQTYQRLNCEHTWEKTEVISSPSCEKDGVGQFSCPLCGATKTDTIDAHGHRYSTNVTYPTCTRQGYTSYTCSYCYDHYIDDYVSAKDHTEVVDAQKPATCTESGLTEGKHCSMCRTVLVAQEEIPAAGHSFSDWVEVKAPTKKAPGLSERVCASCGEKEQRELEQLESGLTEEPTQTEPSASGNSTEVQKNDNSVVLIVVLSAIGGVSVGIIAVLIVIKKKR